MIYVFVVFAIAFVGLLTAIFFLASDGSVYTGLFGAVAGSILLAVTSVVLIMGEIEDQKVFDASIVDLEKKYDVSIDRSPDNTTIPNLWKIDGVFRTCYAEGIPDQYATEKERDADPALWCEKAGSDTEFVKYDDLEKIAPGVRE